MSEKLGNFLDDVSVEDWNEASLKSWNDLNQKTFFELLKPGGSKVEGSIENGLSENRFRELLNTGVSKMNKDKVNKPEHYQSDSGIECIDAIRASMSPLEFQGYCKGNITKYNWRWRDKGGVEDLRKAAVYQGWLVESATALE